MAKKRVIAHFMRESERDQVTPYLSNSVVTDGFAYGEIEETEIEGLKKRGIVFQALDEPKGPPRTSPDAAQERVSSASADPWMAASPGAPPSPSSCFFLKLSGPLFANWRKELESLGVDFREAKADYEWVTRIPSKNLAAVRALGYVADLRMRQSDRNLPTRQELAPFGSPGNLNAMITYDVRLDPKRRACNLESTVGLACRRLSRCRERRRSSVWPTPASTIRTRISPVASCA
jgi:hypothetical protein